MRQQAFILLGLFLASAVTASAEKFDDYKKALKNPQKATSLSIVESNPDLKHLPPELGRLVNLRELIIACQENLEDLPAEIGELKKLERLILDNGNGCTMNVAIPESIGQLQNLKVLNLRGALDGKTKPLPKSIGGLANLEELVLSRNGLEAFPAEWEFPSNSKLKRLDLTWNNIHKLPLSLNNLKGLQVSMGDNHLTPQEQAQMRRLFPNIVFVFENEYE